MSFWQLFSAVMRIDETQKRLEHKFDSMISNLEAANKISDTTQEEAQKWFEDKLTQQLAHMEVKLDNKVLSRVEKEEDDKERRKCNVIIHGLHEPTAIEVDDRSQEDCDLAKKLLHKPSCDDVLVNHMARLGTPPTGSDHKVRPVKLEFATADAISKKLETRDTSNIEKYISLSKSNNQRTRGSKTTCPGVEGEEGGR